MATVSRKRRITRDARDSEPPEGDDAYERQITAAPRERPPADHDDVYAALPDLVCECDGCGEVEPAPVDAAVGNTFACAYCGKFAVVKEP